MLGSQISCWTSCYGRPGLCQQPNDIHHGPSFSSATSATDTIPVNPYQRPPRDPKRPAWARLTGAPPNHHNTAPPSGPSSNRRRIPPHPPRFLTSSNPRAPACLNLPASPGGARWARRVANVERSVPARPASQGCNVDDQLFLHGRRRLRAVPALHCASRPVVFTSCVPSRWGLATSATLPCRRGRRKSGGPWARLGGL